MKRRWALVALAALGTVGLVALGIWQLERRVWKLALIERVEQRIHAAPVAAPGPARWASLGRQNAEYLRVTATGHYLQDRETLVRAVTQLGGGFWVLTPFQTDEGFIVLVNRGFVPPERRDRASRKDDVTAGAHTSVTGLLRITEPNGGFLHTNVPAEERWYSRDVAAISHSRNLPGSAPYFIDAEASTTTTTRLADAGASPNGTHTAAGESGSEGAAPQTPAKASPETAPLPVAGLTVVTFRNSHLLYAFTWFGLASMVGALGVRMARHR